MELSEFESVVASDSCDDVLAMQDDNWTIVDINQAISNEQCNCSQLADSLNDKFKARGQPELNCFALLHPLGVQVAYTTLFLVTVASALIGNLIVIWIILRHRRMRTVTNYFLLNLAVADACISLLNVIMSFTFNLYYDWFFGEMYCYVNNLFSVAPTCASSATLMLMSWERYNVIVFPLRRRLSRAVTLSVICGIWLFAFLSALPNMLATNYSAYYNPDASGAITTKYLCNAGMFDPDNNGTGIWYEMWFRRYNWYLLLIQYVLPLGVLSYTYLCITQELWCHKNIGDHINEEQLKTKKKVVKMLGAVVLIFMCCWLPYHLYFILFSSLQELFYQYQLAHLYLWIYWLAMSTPVWPPIIYYNMNTRFKIGFKYVFRWTGLPKLSYQEYASSELFEQRMCHRSNASSRMQSRRPTTSTSLSTSSCLKARLLRSFRSTVNQLPVNQNGPTTNEEYRQKFSLQPRNSELQLRTEQSLTLIDSRTQQAYSNHSSMHSWRDQHRKVSSRSDDQGFATSVSQQSYPNSMRLGSLNSTPIRIRSPNQTRSESISIPSSPSSPAPTKRISYIRESETVFGSIDEEQPTTDVDFNNAFVGTRHRKKPKLRTVSFDTDVEHRVLDVDKKVTADVNDDPLEHGQNNVDLVDRSVHTTGTGQGMVPIYV